MKPCSEACERGRAPILGVLQQVFAGRKSVLETGAGTGQHAVYFALQLPCLAAAGIKNVLSAPEVRS